MIKTKRGALGASDMTKGDPLKLILLFSIPILLGNVFQQIYQLVDTNLAGRYFGDEGIAAIGATSSINSLIIGFATGICSGFSILVARAFGAKDESAVKSAVALMTAELAIVAVLFTALSLIFLRPLLLAMRTPDEIFEESYSYIFCVLAGIPVTLFYNYGACILRALGNSRVPLYFLLAACVANVGLDILFTGVFGLGIFGLALATVAAQLFSAVGSILYLFLRYHIVRFTPTYWKAPKAAYFDMFTTGFFMGAMTVVYDVGSVILQASVNDLGTTVIAAHTAARKILMMLIQPLVTLGTACATFAGQNYGAKEYGRIKAGLSRTCLFSLVFSTAIFLLLVTCSAPLVRFVSHTQDEEVVSLAVMNMHINAPFYFPVGFVFPLRMGLQAFNHKIMPVLSG
ncbi:MAG: MATE family efflux transporter, partial [Christensenellaceae bacterium]